MAKDTITLQEVLNQIIERMNELVSRDSLDARLGEIHRRLDNLERDSHPPAALPLERIERRLDHLANLVGEVLVYTRIRGGDLEPAQARDLRRRLLGGGGGPYVVPKKSTNDEDESTKPEPYPPPESTTETQRKARELLEVSGGIGSVARGGNHLEGSEGTFVHWTGLSWEGWRLTFNESKVYPWLATKRVEGREAMTQDASLESLLGRVADIEGKPVPDQLPLELHEAVEADNERVRRWEKR